MKKPIREDPGTRKVYLKSKNTAFLWSFIGINLAVFLALLAGKQFSRSSVEQFWKKVNAKDEIIAACIPIMTIVLSGLVDDATKARLVFWRWRNPLPGSRVFTELVHEDSRIDIHALRSKCGEFPVDPREQNALWYRLYKKHRDTITVSEAHKSYLLTRDMTAISAVFVILLSTGCLASSVGGKGEVAYCAALILQYLMISTSARNYGKRFVLNVVTEESHGTSFPARKVTAR